MSRSGRARRNRLPELSLRTWLLYSHLLVLALPLLALIGTGALARDLIDQTRADLEHQADVLAVFVGDLAREQARAGEASELEPLADRVEPLLVEVRERTLAGVRLLDDRGLVIAAGGPIDRVDLSDDPEVAAALAGETGVAMRERPPASASQGLDSESRRARVRLFVAEPVLGPSGEVIGVILLSRTPREELQALYQMSPRLAWGLLLALLVTIGLAVFAGRLGTRSLARLADAARRLTHGSGSEGTAVLRSAGSHVDEVRELATAVASMAEQLEARVAYINEFAGNVAHEFRTPIATLRGTAELLRDDEAMPAEQRQRFLDNALDELDRLERLVDGLLELARAERAHEGTRVELGALLRALAQRWPDLELELADDPLAVVGSPAQLASVLDNLIDNAYQHGGEAVGVKVRSLIDDERGELGFEVVDEGPGISAANQVKVFERFFTTNREGGGTGLGLAIVRRIVETHGGRIELESRPGATRFRVWLPRG
ncbi:sensor histidine kinase [Nannocystaceae bacterium ST9]